MKFSSKCNFKNIPCTHWQSYFVPTAENLAKMYMLVPVNRLSTIKLIVLNHNINSLHKIQERENIQVVDFSRYSFKLCYCVNMNNSYLQCFTNDDADQSKCPNLFKRASFIKPMNVRKINKSKNNNKRLHMIK